MVRYFVNNHLDIFQIDDCLMFSKLFQAFYNPLLFIEVENVLCYLIVFHFCLYFTNISIMFQESPTTNATERKRLTLETTDSADGSEHLSDSECRLKRKRREVQETRSNAETERTECEAYSQLLVHKLMKLEEDDRLFLMNKIDNLVFEATMEAKAKKKIKPNIFNQISCEVRSSAYQQSSPQRLSPVNYIFHHTSYSPPIATDDLQCTSIEVQNTEVKTEI